MKYSWRYFKNDYKSDLVDLTTIGIKNISNVILNVPFKYSNFINKFRFIPIILYFKEKIILIKTKMYYFIYEVESFSNTL